MEAWAHQQNIDRFERTLATETDPERRRLLLSLIEQEQARLDELRAKRAAPAED